MWKRNGSGTVGGSRRSAVAGAVGRLSGEKCSDDNSGVEREARSEMLRRDGANGSEPSVSVVI